MKQHELNRQQSLARVKRVIDLQEQGMTRREACDKLGYRYDTMCRAIRRYYAGDTGKEKLEYGRHEVLKDPIVKLYRAGKSQKDIASIFGVSQHTVSRYVLGSDGYVRRHHRSEK